MKKHGKRRLVFVLCALLLCAVGITAISVSAGAEEGKADAMTAIQESLGTYQIGSTVTESTDGYIGIPVKVSVFYDKTKGKATAGYSGTPVILYFVNTAVERIGTESDVSIITSMLERGYVVVTMDYQNNAKAVSPDLDWSSQSMRAKVSSRKYFTDSSAFETSGTYSQNYVVPAGYDVLLNQVYWEIDKHGADGSLEKIVEIWNNDFRGHYGDTIISWVHEDGTRKATQTAFDNTEPVWEDETHIKIKYTKAEVVTDCVKKDGSPIDLSLYMNLTYPTSPENEVPVMCQASSAENLASGTQVSDRPQLSGFLFNGYAAANFDFCYVPMARSDHYGYYDGNQSTGHVTGDNNTYSLQFYNNINVDTAAMRYLRYLAASDDTYKLDTTKIGVFGNSKGGWMTPLGEEDPTIFRTRRVFEGHHGETRYENDITASYTQDGATIDGGTAQPWLTYGGEKLDSGADLIYASCGGADEYITESHVPTFISCHQGDSSYYGTSNKFVQAARAADIPALWFEVAQGHTLATENDVYHAVNTYNAFFDFANYYLKGDAVKVVYLDTEADYGGMPTSADFVLKFTGPVSAEEVAKVTVTLKDGTPVAGTWSSAFGNTEWTFSHATLPGDTEYTVTVPASVKGDNGKEMGEDYAKTFRTGYEANYAVSSAVRTDGTAFWFTMPDTSALSFTANVMTLRLNVTGESTNSVKLYALTGFDSASPSSATCGSLLATVAVGGAGCYDVDITSLLASVKTGDTVAFLAKESKAAGQTTVYSAPLSSSLGSVSTSNCSASIAVAPDSTPALKVEKATFITQYTSETYYQSIRTVVSDKTVLGSAKITDADVGRHFVITGKIYDTTSRLLVVRLYNYTSSAYSSADYIGATQTVLTKAGEWVEFKIDYTVYEAPEAYTGTLQQTLYIMPECTGNAGEALYFKDFKTVETVTNVTYDAASPATLLLSTTEQRTDPNITEYGLIPTSFRDAETYPFLVFDGNGKCLGGAKEFYGEQYSSSAIGIAKNYLASNKWSGTSYGTSELKAFILMRRDYTLGTGEYYDNLAQIQGTLVIDLGGYTFTQPTDAKSVLFRVSSKGWSGSGDAVMFPTTMKIKNGSLETTTGAVMALSVWDSAADGTIVNKIFTMDFEKVNFSLTEGATATSLLTQWSNGTSKTGAKGPFVLNYTDCNFDITGVTSALFSASTAAAQYATVDLTVKGGNVTSDTMEGKTLFTTSDGNTLTLAANEEDEYLTLTLPKDATPPTSAVTTSAGARAYNTFAADGENKIWSLGELAGLNTIYGTIPTEYASVDDYPFVVFDESGNCIGAYNCFYGANSGTSAFGKAKTHVAANKYVNGSYGDNPKSAVVLMRRDYTFASTEKFDNLAQVQGTVTVDLGGFALSAYAGSSNRLIAATAKGWAGSGDAAVFPTTLCFKNGKLLGTAQPILTVNCSDTTAGRDLSVKAFTIDFTDITFGLAEGATTKVPLFDYWDGSTAGTKAPFTLNFTDCTIDFATVEPAKKSIIFKGTASDSSYVTSTVNVKGCNILANDLTKFQLYSGSVNFMKNADGDYICITLPDSVAGPTYNVMTAEGEKVFSLESSADGKSVYKAGGVKTAYGLIPEEFADTDKYPFVTFDENGTLLYEGNVFYSDSGDSAVGKAKTYVAKNSWSGTSYGDHPKSAYVLMRRDFDLVKQVFNNFAQVQGEITIDLGGFTLYRDASSNEAIFKATAKGWSGSGDAKIFPSTITIKNGTISVTAKQAGLTCNTWDSLGDGSIKNKIFTFNFEDITFVRTAASAVSNWVVDYWNPSGTPKAACPFVLNYKNCTYDTTYSTTTGNIFYAKTVASQYIDLTYTVDGAKILANSMTQANLVTGTPKLSGDISLVLPEGKDASSLYMTLTDGKTYYFTEGTDSWTLALPRITGFKQNVAFQTNFKTNVYIPKLSDKVVTGVSYNGTPLTLGEREIEGVNYWVATVEVDAEEANEKIALVITFTYGGNTYTQTISTNIVNYANALAKYAEYADLANAMLYYAKCAAPEAGITATRVEATKVAAVNTMKADTPITGASVAIASAPVFTFTLNGTFEGSVRFTWKSGEATSTVTKEVLAGDTSLVLNELMVYDFTETISVAYSADGENFTDAGSYNLSAYAESAAGQTNADLVNALYDYAEQAKAYTYAE